MSAPAGGQLAGRALSSDLRAGEFADDAAHIVNRVGGFPVILSPPANLLIFEA
jgi:hypothetical protein